MKPFTKGPARAGIQRRILFNGGDAPAQDETVVILTVIYGLDQTFQQGHEQERPFNQPPKQPHHRPRVIVLSLILELEVLCTDKRLEDIGAPL